MKEPGLHRTLLGDGIATSVSAFLGGPANTTYGENTGVIGMTRIASVSVIRNAAFIAIYCFDFNNSKRCTWWYVYPSLRGYRK